MSSQGADVEARSEFHATTRGEHFVFSKAVWDGLRTRLDVGQPDPMSGIVGGYPLGTPIFIDTCPCDDVSPSDGPDRQVGQDG